jgi:hypothetical protein
LHGRQRWNGRAKAERRGSAADVGGLHASPVIILSLLLGILHRRTEKSVSATMQNGDMAILIQIYEVDDGHLTSSATALWTSNQPYYMSQSCFQHAPMSQSVV